MAGGARVVDARTFAVDAAGFAGEMLLAQCDTKFVCSDVKLALLMGAALGKTVPVALMLGMLATMVPSIAILAKHGKAGRKMGITGDEDKTPAALSDQPVDCVPLRDVERISRHIVDRHGFVSRLQ